MKENRERKEIIEAYESCRANESKYMTYGNIAHMHRLSDIFPVMKMHYLGIFFKK